MIPVSFKEPPKDKTINIAYRDLKGDLIKDTAYFDASIVGHVDYAVLDENDNLVGHIEFWSLIGD